MKRRVLIHGVVIGSLAVGGTAAALARDTATATRTRPGTTTTTNGNATATATVGAAGVPQAPKNDNTPKVYESAENKVKFTAPGNWDSHGPPGMKTGDIVELDLPIDKSALPKLKPGARPAAEPIRVFTDSVVLNVEPLVDPEANVASTVAEVRAFYELQDPKAAFKPVEKAKIAGLDASVLTVTAAGDDIGEPNRIERNVIFVRDGKAFRLTLKSHANTFGKAVGPFGAVVKSFEFTAPPEEGKALTKAYTLADHKLQFTAPVGWTQGATCHDNVCQGGITSLLIPLDSSLIPRAKDLPPGAMSAAIHSDAVTIAANPASDPKGTLDGAVEDVKKLVTAQFPKAEFKSADKIKVSGEEAVALSITIPGEARDGEKQRVQRRVVMLRDGKVYQIAHQSHVQTVAKQKKVFDGIVSSFQFASAAPATGAPAAAGAPVNGAAVAGQPAAAKGTGDGLD